MLLLIELHLPKILRLVEVLRLFICWGCLGCLVVTTTSRHVLNKIHSLGVVLNNVLSLWWVLQWWGILFLLFLDRSWGVERIRLTAKSIDHIHLVGAPLVVVPYLISNVHHLILNCLSLLWLLLLDSVENIWLILQLLLQIDLIHQVSQAMNLNLLYLVCVFSNFLVLVYVLQLKLALNIELKGFHQVFIGVLGWFLVILPMTIQFFSEPALVIH